MFLEELRAGIPPVISESTDVLLRSLQLAHPPNARLMQMPGITMNETNVRNVFLLEREDIGALPALATHLLEVGGSSHR